jgi:hypothetical protein
MFTYNKYQFSELAVNGKSINDYLIVQSKMDQLILHFKINGY